MKNFKGKSLSGESFLDQDLTGVDFSDANLKNVKFSEAKKMGKTFWQILFQLGTDLLIGFSLCFAMGFVAVFAYRGFVQLLGSMHKQPSYLSVFIFISLQAILMRFFIFTIEKQSMGTLDKDFFVGTIVALVVAGSFGSASGMGAMVGTLLIILGSTVVLTLVSLLLAITGGLATAVAALGILIVISDNTMQLIKSEGKDLATSDAALDVVRMFLASSGSCILLLIFGYYMVTKASKYEAVPFLPIRNWLLTWRCRGSTNFTGGTLYECDFSNTNLKYIRFNNANIVRCNFKGSKNLHLADTRNTSLEAFIARQITLTEREKQTPLEEITKNKDFKNHNLRGVNFSNLDLSGCSFYHADLSEADFRCCKLEDCDLSETMAFGTLFDNAKFTGAIIDNWNVDKTTRFKGAQCKFVYLKRKIENLKVKGIERNPPVGEFIDGDFARLYQEIANTVDFIAHTPEELGALLLAIKQIKNDGGKIVIQRLESKDNVLSVGMKIDVNAEYYKTELFKVTRDLIKDGFKDGFEALKNEFMNQFLVQQEKSEKENQKEYKDNELGLCGLTTKGIIFQFIMNNDNSRYIVNSILSGNVVNLGDNANLTNFVQNLPKNPDE